jgi:cytochrome c peroxidase
MIATKPRFTFIIAVLCTSFIIACNKNSDTPNNSGDGTDPAVTAALNLPSSPFNYANQALPAYLNTPNIAGQINTPGTNPITDNGATLGRVLFYDKNLSANSSISCASCHKQVNAFSDVAVKSLGFNGGQTGRNSMPLTNAKYYPNGRFFWDQRAATLEDQVLMPVQDLVEMGMTLSGLETKLKTLAYYPSLFQKAFGDATITSDRISKALAQFVRSIVSFQSKYDAGRGNFPAGPLPPGTVFPNFTAQENQGMAIFLGPQGGCTPCHGTETFTAPQEKNNGLDLTTVDRGFGAVVNNTALDATFKVGSLRNIELTSPYMHDGRFTTLDQVVEHYSSGVKAHPNLSPQLKLPNGQPRLANFTAQEKTALVAFLRTLTDLNMTADVKYSNPFK